MEKIDFNKRYPMKQVMVITGKNPQQINYYIKKGIIKDGEYIVSNPNRGHRKSILGIAVQRIIDLYGIS